MASVPYTRLLWIDLETTGSDTQLDPILEFGAAVTTLDFETLFEFGSVIKPASIFQVSDRLQLLPEVFEMHQASGLLDELSSGSDLDSTVHSLVKELLEFAKPGEFLLAGSGVASFDRRFLAECTPEIHDLLHYSVFDLGIFRRGMRMLAPHLALPNVTDSIGPTKAHRALADVQAHIREARAVREFLANCGHASTPQP